MIRPKLKHKFGKKNKLVIELEFADPEYDDLLVKITGFVNSNPESISKLPGGIIGAFAHSVKQLSGIMSADVLGKRIAGYWQGVIEHGYFEVTNGMLDGLSVDEQKAYMEAFNSAMMQYFESCDKLSKINCGTIQ